VDSLEIVAPLYFRKEIEIGTISQSFGAFSHILGDFSNLEEMESIVKASGCEFVCSSTNDFSEISASFVAEKLNLPGYDSFKTTKILHHKDSFRKICSDIDIRAPKSISVNLSTFNVGNDLKEIALTFPVLVKPVDLSGGKGIGICHDPDELFECLDQSLDSRSREKRVVIEEFINGSNHGATFIVLGKEVVFDFFDVEHYGKNKYLVLGTSTNHSLSDQTKRVVRDYVDQLVAHLNLKDGLIHVQFMISSTNVFLIEVTRRTPGDLYTKFVELSTGYEYSSAIFASKVGLSFESRPSKSRVRHISRLAFHPDRNGIVRDFSLHPRAETHLIDYFDLKKRNIADHTSEKVGIGFFEFDSESEQIEFVSDFNQLITFEYEDRG
jgi:biotin carboxylase